MDFEIREMKNLTGAKARVYSVILDGEENTLLEQFFNEKELAKTRKRMMLAAKIEEAMKRCGYNQTQFAHLMQKSTTVISEWLSGDRNFTTDTLMDIEDALGIRLLDTSIMTAVNAGTEISMRISANTGKSETMSLRGTWGLRDNYRESEYQANCA